MNLLRLINLWLLNVTIVSHGQTYALISESVSRPLVNFGVLNDNLIKWLISFVKCIRRF
jgi:hypothetical protein